MNFSYPSFARKGGGRLLPVPPLSISTASDQSNNCRNLQRPQVFMNQLIGLYEIAQTT